LLPQSWRSATSTPTAQFKITAVSLSVFIVRLPAQKRNARTIKENADNLKEQINYKRR